ncbi:MAG: N-acetylmuramoyl-L-alanine amidase-like domain-containing protein [Candidatus Hydrogenedentota bacterium]
MFVPALFLSLALTLGDAPALWQMEPAELTAYLTEVHDAHPNFERRLTRVVRDSVGTPYAPGPLGEGPDGQYDTDPLMDLSRVDCVTFIEQGSALAACKTYDQAHALLQRIRYKEGRIGYEHRNHFMISDWVANNRAWCREITGDAGTPTKTETRSISRRDFFDKVDAPDLGEDTPDEKIALTYIPSAEAGAALDHIEAPTMVVFIGNIDWLFALHTGLLIARDDGPPRLYHASSKAEKVVAASLTDYLEEQAGRYLGIALYRLEAPRWEEDNRTTNGHE